MPLPDCVQDEGDHVLFGTAAGLGADADSVLLSKLATKAYITAKEFTGNCIPIHLFDYP